MPDVPDINTPLPDLAHESLRQSVVAALGSVTEQIDRIDNAFLMLSINADFAQATKNTVASATTQMQGLGQQLAAINATLTALQAAQAALTARVTALETPA